MYRTAVMAESVALGEFPKGSHVAVQYDYTVNAGEVNQEHIFLITNTKHRTVRVPQRVLDRFVL